MKTLYSRHSRTGGRLGALALAVSLGLAAPGIALAQDDAGNIRGSTTGPTTAKGFDYPGHSLHLQDKKPAPNMYPALSRPEQDSAAAKKLADLEAKTGKKPNVLFFLLDDVGWMDPGFNGGGVAVGNATPNMDEFALDGLILTSAYSTPSCSPSRATIHTGQNPLHHGILRPPMYGEAGGLDGALTLPKLLQEKGYTTMGVGKWHMGENKGSLPQNVGYDEYVGFLGVSDMYTEWRDVYMNPEVALSPSRFKMMEEDGFNHYEVTCSPSDTEKCEDGKLIDLEYIKHLDQHWKETSLDFLDKQKGAEDPFFLYHATRGCHFDNYPSDDYAGKSAASTVYSDCIVEMDDVFGTLMSKLEEIGELENTMVILTSDNGPECEIPPHGRTPFRGCKGSAWEGGVRVPTFVYWKDMIEPRKSDGLFDFADVLPTVMSMNGVKGADIGGLFDDTTYIDGVDQASFLIADNGESNRRSRPYTINQYYAGSRIDEFKGVITGELQDSIFSRGDIGGFSGALFTDTGGAIAINLYTNPQEDVNVGVRHIPALVPVMATQSMYIKELMDYPPQFKIGFSGNNPPLYNLAPEAREAMKKIMNERGLGRHTP
ncbi:sulfatase-like hydrolase/transferase [Chachezhania antarctica]|uniref:sulfatase-like hydrolase/transferase n=1 Tax=Chachezhania antarctica TaxID=2340860 RepID=UPI001F08A02F|nr:sulfatase-like hydrolase/transferase [Chachezhania antarctica]